MFSQTHGCLKVPEQKVTNCNVGIIQFVEETGLQWHHRCGPFISLQDVGLGIVNDLSHVGQSNKGFTRCNSRDKILGKQRRLSKLLLFTALLLFI